MSKCNIVEMSWIFNRILGPFVLGWAPNHFVLGAQLAPGEKRLACIHVMTPLNAHPDIVSNARGLNFGQVFIYTYT